MPDAVAQSQQPVPSLALDQPASRADRVHDALRRAILEGTLEPGRLLVERELAEMFGVSKTPVREALKLLRATGLVELNSYQGASVRRITTDTVVEVYTARAMVEPQAVRQATLNSSQSRDLSAAEAALDEAALFLKQGKVVPLVITNRRFHRELYVACGNKLVSGFLDQLQDLTAFLASAGWRVQQTFEYEAKEHAAILEAVRAGDADLAERLTRQHIDNAKSVLAEALTAS